MSLSPSEKVKLVESVNDPEVTSLRAEIRENLRKIACSSSCKRKSKRTTRLSKMKNRLTELTQDASQREKWLEEDDEPAKVNGFHEKVNGHHPPDPGEADK